MPRRIYHLSNTFFHIMKYVLTGIICFLIGGLIVYFMKLDIASNLKPANQKGGIIENIPKVDDRFPDGTIIVTYSGSATGIPNQLFYAKWTIKNQFLRQETDGNDLIMYGEWISKHEFVEHDSGLLTHFTIDEGQKVITIHNGLDQKFYWY
jgi:hypothetical protein